MKHRSIFVLGIIVRKINDEKNETVHEISSYKSRLELELDT